LVSEILRRMHVARHKTIGLKRKFEQRGKEEYSKPDPEWGVKNSLKIPIT